MADLAERVMAERGLNTADKRLVKTMVKRVGACLRDHRRKGVVRSEQTPDRFLRWRSVATYATFEGRQPSGSG